MKCHPNEPMHQITGNLWQLLVVNDFTKKPSDCATDKNENVRLCERTHTTTYSLLFVVWSLYLFAV